jgi:hypothetical protein
MLKERGTALLSLEKRIDTNSAAGELVFHVFGAIAHFRAAPDRRDLDFTDFARHLLPGSGPLRSIFQVESLDATRLVKTRQP